MREFMTKVSDYLNERREDPERKEDRLSLVVIGAVAVVVIVLVLLLLWGYTTAQEKKQKEAEQKAQELLQEQMEEQELTAVTYEEKMAEYMSQNAGEELRQEYLTSTSDLGEKVKELQTTLEQVQKEVEKLIKENQEEGQTEKLTQLEKEIKTVLERIREMEAKYADLSDLIQTIDKEKITMIQQQIQAFQAELEQVRTDVAGIHSKIAALEKEDRALWEKLSKVEQSLAGAMEKELNEIDQRMDDLFRDLEKKINALAAEGLAYRYEQRTNTLYLMPNQKSGTKEAQP